MNRGDVLEKVQDICRDEFEDDSIIITDETVAADVDGWDSLSHIALINEIENEFGIKFTMGEIQDSKNVGELIDAIIRHKQKA